MTYNITKYSFAKAKELGVTIKPASNPLKKIDVFDRDGKKQHLQDLQKIMTIINTELKKELIMQ